MYVCGLGEIARVDDSEGYFSRSLSCIIIIVMKKKCRQAAGGRLPPRNQIVATFLMGGAAEKF